MNRITKIVATLAFMLATAGAAAADETARAWDAMRGDGHVALIRHAAAPGGAGDPPGYRIGDCATQRNLSEGGRAQARALGETFRTQRVKVGKVIASQWCRSRQTAELMAIGPVEEAPTFNNAFVLASESRPLTDGARALIAAWRGPGTLVVATHGQNIAHLTGLYAAEGEVIVVMPDPASAQKFRVVGRTGR